MSSTDPSRPAPRVTASRRRSAALLPASSLAGRSLVIVIVIMAFLASMTAGSVQLIAAASSEWTASVAREVTIQIRPRAGRDIDADVRRAGEMAQRTPGIANVRIYSRAEAERLLEPWLGGGLALADLPVPRLIVLKLADGATPDLPRLRSELGALPSASLDDHRLWLQRLATMANTLVVIGIAVLALVLTAMALAIVFATRGAMAGNREIIDVLHLVGAEDRFIAREFRHHFLQLGLRGGVIGGALAVVAFLVASAFSSRWVTSAGGDQVEALFGRFSLGWAGYLSILMIVGLVAFITAVVSRKTVFRNLRGLE